MLVLSRKEGEKIVIADRITITVVRLSGNRVAVGIEAPDEVRIVRGELPPQARKRRDAADVPSQGDPEPRVACRLKVGRRAALRDVLSATG